MLNFKQIFHSKNLSYFISLFFFILIVVIILKQLSSIIENFETEKEKDIVTEKEKDIVTEKDPVIKESFVKPLSYSFTKSSLNPIKF